MSTRAEATFYRKLGRTVKAMRHRDGISQRALVKAAGLSVGYLSDFENGKRGISGYNMVRLCEALGCTLLEMFTWSGIKNPSCREEVQ